MKKLSDIIDSVMELPFLPLDYTGDSKRKCTRVFGVFLFLLCFFPSGMIAITITAILAIPSLIQDA